MARKKKYLFNAETLAYEVHKIPFMKRVSNGFLLFLLSFIVSIGYYFIYTRYFKMEEPKLLALRQKSAELHSKLDILNRKFERCNKILLELQMRDNNVYRPIFGMEEISQEVRNAGFGGVNRYERFENFVNSSFITNVEKKMDILYKKAFVQSRSYDEVSTLAKRADKMASSVPAIPPINLDKTKLSSRFGFRIDPVYGGAEFHQGIDLSAKSHGCGELVYSTGKGRVQEVNFNFFGYGTEVVVEHGFGYMTRYAHLSRTLVRRGDMVLRGQQIAEMGNTGKSTAPHLHYEVMYKQKRVNPLNYFDWDLRGEKYRDLLNAGLREDKKHGQI